LTLWALPHIFLDVVEHLGPVIPLVDGLVGDRVSPGMIFTVVVVNLLYYALHFLGSEAPQVLVRV